MVDVGLYAITPYQFRIAHELNLENFQSPTVDERHFVEPRDSNNHISPLNEQISNHHRNGFKTPDKPKSKSRNGYHTKNETGETESSVFTLTLSRRPEKRERSRSGSELISPEPKRTGLPSNDVIFERPCDLDLGKSNINGCSRRSSEGSDDDLVQSPCSPNSDQMDSCMFTSFNSDNVIVIVRDDVTDDVTDDSSKEFSESLTDSIHSNDGAETPRCQQSPYVSHTEAEDSQSGSEQNVVVRRKRRPRKLPQIPASVQRKSVACIMRTHSLADELSDADPVIRKNQRAFKSKSWIETTSNSAAWSSQDSCLFNHSFQSLDDLGSPEVVDPQHVEQVHKEIVEMTMSQSQSNLEQVLQGPSQSQCHSPQSYTSGIPHSMSMSLRDELESEGVPINNDLGSAFCDHSEYIDDEMPKLKRYFGEDAGVQHTNNHVMASRCDRLQPGYSNQNSLEDGADAVRSKSSRCRNLSSSSSTKDNNNHTADSSRRGSSSSTYSDLEAYDATHRGCHKFVPRHDDEMFIEIGDLVFVEDEADDLWCEGINLRTGQHGIFPAAYATDLSLLEVDGMTKFKLRFLGSLEVTQHKGDDVICKAIQKVANSRKQANNLPPSPLYCLEINEYGIKMIDLSKKGRRNSPKRSSIRERLAKILNKEYKKEESHDLFFSLKNVSFCGYHPQNERYFAFITKHPMESRFACHVFLSHRSTKPIAEAVGTSFKKFYQEYMAFMHPTEDIYME